MADLTCPFCNDDNFDRIGLKLHLQRGWCDAFNETPTTDRPEPVKSLDDAGVRVLDDTQRLDWLSGLPEEDASLARNPSGLWGVTVKRDGVDHLLGVGKTPREALDDAHGVTPTRGPLTKDEVDALVYQCRQAGDDSTYALVRAVEATHGVARADDETKEK